MKEQDSLQYALPSKPGNVFRLLDAIDSPFLHLLSRLNAPDGQIFSGQAVAGVEYVIGDSSFGYSYTATSETFHLGEEARRQAIIDVVGRRKDPAQVRCDTYVSPYGLSFCIEMIRQFYSRWFGGFIVFSKYPLTSHDGHDGSIRFLLGETQVLSLMWSEPQTRRELQPLVDLAKKLKLEPIPQKIVAKAELDLIENKV